MLAKTFKFRLIERALILAATLLVFAFTAPHTDLLFVSIAIVLAAGYQIYSLIHFAEKTNRDISRFLLSIKYDDTSLTFSGDELGDSFSDLNASFRQIIQKLKEARSEMEVHSRYLDTVIQHIGIGLLAYKSDGTVFLLNNAAKKHLKVTGINNINHMQERSPELTSALRSLKQGDKKLVKFQNEGEICYFSISTHTFLLREERCFLASIQNIQAELEEKEMEAWQNLIKVLTHEIMNSITPISSMTATLIDMIGNGSSNESSPSAGISLEDIGEMREALKTIHHRSEGLMSFVNSYRNMTLIPKPKFKLLSVSEFFRRIEKLLNHKLTGNNIAFQWAVEPETLELTADPNLLEQVFINLLLNAVQAVMGKKNPAISLSASLSPEGKVIIAVADNGVGIVEEALEKIFIPFFTTRKQGSGIGLSLSRQILRLHNASISVKSTPNEGSVFTLRFG
jgi:two-component system, NtrC family, nitrogen regulation sensor histidine kinase NtrY